MKRLIVILITLSLTGCYNYKELNQIVVVSSFIVDKIDNEYILYLNTIKIDEDKTSIETNKGKGLTIIEAARNINNYLSKSLLNSNLEYVILSKEVIKNNLNEVIDYLSRDTLLPFNFLILTTDNIDNILNEIKTIDIPSLIKISSKKNGYTYQLNFKTLLNNYLSKEKETLYPSINIKDNKLQIDSMFYFNNNEEIKLTKEEALSFNIINNNLKNSVITINCNDKYFSLETLKTKIEKSSNKELKIKPYIETKLISYECSLDLNKINNIKKLEELANDYINKIITSSINNMKKDYLGINNTNINIDTSIKITKLGTLRGDLI